MLSISHVRAVTFVMLLVGAAIACGSSDGNATPPSDTDSGMPHGDDAALPSRALLPNEVVYAFAGESGADRASLVPGSVLGADVVIEVPRFAGSYTPDPSPTKGPRLADFVAVGSVGATARLSFRVKNTGGLSWLVRRKNAQTGGEWAALETSAHAPIALPDIPNDDAFHVVSVTFPTAELALARAMASPEENAFELALASAPTNEQAGTRAALAGVAVDFFAQAPVVLVHGINDNPANCFGDYAASLTAAGLVPDLRVDFAGLADKPGIGGGAPTFNGSVADDVARIDARLQRLRTDYGTSDVHLVGHSKGGLDLVNYLATVYPARKAHGDVRVLSLQTLGTPHAGSVYADLEEPLKAWAIAQNYAQTADWASWGVVIDDSTDGNVLDTLTLSGIKESILEGTGPIDPGLRDITTYSEAVKTDLAWMGDPDVHFSAYGFDADFERARWIDVTGQLTTPPAEGDLIPKYSTDCRGNPVGGARWSYYCIDEDEVDTFFWGTLYYPPSGTTCSGWNQCGAPLYRPMARGVSATVLSGPLPGGTRSTIHMVSRAAGEWDGNDLVVALSSARHPHATSNVVRQGAASRTIPGQRRIDPNGGVETFDATCGHTGANHISILHASRANMVACTVADTGAWIRDSAAVLDVPPDGAESTP